MSLIEIILYPAAILALTIYVAYGLAEWSANRQFIKELKKRNHEAENV